MFEFLPFPHLVATQETTNQIVVGRGLKNMNVGGDGRKKPQACR